jgi:hypothetical protein
MNKKIVVGILALALTVPATSHANIKNRTVTTPTLAILDTALDTSIPSIKEKLIYEVCILEWTTCPNGQSFMEGPGSSTLPLASITKNGFDHGTQMASIAIAANPNMNIVFVRVIGQNVNLDRQITGEKTVSSALDWVYANKDRFNIQAVSMSLGDSNISGAGHYCPSTPNTQKSINNLLSSGIPSFFPTGNGRNYNRIDWPSCIPESFAIGSGSKNGIDLISNSDQLLTDFYSLGNTKAIYPGNVIKNAAGTSVSAQIAASQWIALKQSKPGYTVKQLTDLIHSTSTKINRGKKFPASFGNLFDLTKAING